MSAPTAARPRRLLYLCNHQTLIPAEVPILRELGWEVFIPKKLVDHHQFRSGAITYDYDASLSIPPGELAVLNNHNFYLRRWSPTVTRIINDNFDVVISIVNLYTAPLAEPARKFPGMLIGRVFGREHPRTYTELMAISATPRLLEELAAMGDRFIQSQCFDNIVDVEDEPLRSRGRLVACPLPKHVFGKADAWTGEGGHALFLCPAIGDNDFYQGQYQRIKRDFADLPHRIFGRQIGPVDDPAVLPYMTDQELLEEYAQSAVFVYPSHEPRHLHYSPVEAMVVGCPVLYLKGATIDHLAGGADLPGRCADTKEMHAKASRLIAGDRALADSIRASQHIVVDTTAVELVRKQWAAVLPGPAQAKAHAA